MIDESTGWVITDVAIAHTSDGGQSWTTHDIPPPYVSTDPSHAGSTFPGAYVALDATHAWVARTNAAGDRVDVIRTADGAQTTSSTSIVSGLAEGTPVGMAFADPMHGYVSIASGADPGADAYYPDRTLLYGTSDGGVTFQQIATDAPVPLAFIDAETGWGYADGLFRTNDGGSAWTRVRPPGWDAPFGVAYEVVHAAPQQTVIEMRIGIAEQKFLATADDGATWTDVGPPGTTDLVLSGPVTILSIPSPSDWFGLRQGFDPPSTLLHSTDSGTSYEERTLPFSAKDLTMATATTGMVLTATDVYLTVDGGAAWTLIAEVIAPSTTDDGCVWQPSYDGGDGAGGTQFVWFMLRNASAIDCSPPDIKSVTADGPSFDHIINALGDDAPIIDPLPPDLVVHPGDFVTLQLTTISSTDRCGSPPSRRSDSLAVSFGDNNVTALPLPFAIETACEFIFTVGVLQ